MIILHQIALPLATERPPVHMHVVSGAAPHLSLDLATAGCGAATARIGLATSAQSYLQRNTQQTALLLPWNSDPPGSEGAPPTPCCHHNTAPLLSPVQGQSQTRQSSGTGARPLLPQLYTLLLRWHPPYPAAAAAGAPM